MYALYYLYSFSTESCVDHREAYLGTPYALWPAAKPFANPAIVLFTGKLSAVRWGEASK